MGKSSWDTPRKKLVSLNALIRFQSPIFTFLFNVQPRDSVHETYFNTEKRERGFVYRQKRHFFQLRKDAEKKRLFCPTLVHVAYVESVLIRTEEILQHSSLTYSGHSNTLLFFHATNKLNSSLEKANG